MSKPLDNACEKNPQFNSSKLGCWLEYMKFPRERRAAPESVETPNPCMFKLH